MIIAIDGTSSSGKSSIARELGRRLGFFVLGTGSIYRAIALKMLNLSINENDDDLIEQMLSHTIIENRFENGESSLVLDGIVQNKADLNSPAVANFVPIVAAKENVRQYVRNIQHKEAERNANIIVEGRDIGSVVFPNANIKLFIDADVQTRAKRRLEDYLKEGKKAKLNNVIEEIMKRDNLDRQREISPLIMTSESIIIDTSQISVNESVDKILKIMSDKKLASN